MPFLRACLIGPLLYPFRIEAAGWLIAAAVLSAVIVFQAVQNERLFWHWTLALSFVWYVSGVLSR